MKKQNFILLWVYYFLVFGSLTSYAQNAPVTTAATVGGAIAGSVDVPITVTGFNNIGAVSLSIDYDYSVLQCTGGTPNPLMSSFPIGDLDLETGYHRVTMGWFGSALTLNDGSTIMTLHFTYISGTSALNWYDNGPSCEYADGSYNVLNDIPTTTYYINGFVCGLIGNPGPIDGTTELCPGQTGITYSIAPVANATGYVWAVPPGAIIVTGQNTNAITVDYPPNAVSGNVSVFGTNDCGSGPADSLAVTVYQLPVADAGDDFSIPYGTYTTLHAAPGGTGSFSYHWSPENLLVDPDVQDPQTIMMTSTTIFTVLVTNLESLCQSSDEVVLTITGGPLSINPVALPAAICNGESSQLYSNASGGSENYTYLWTCNPPGSPPWSSNLANPVVSPDSTKQFLLTVYDGYNTLSDSTLLIVSARPTATISGGDTLCGEDEMTTLEVDLTGTPPWSFTYTFGSTTVIVTGQQTSPYVFNTNEPGDYYISSIEDLNCSGISYGSAIVRKYPIPAKPEITIYLTQLISSACCGNQWYLNGDPIPGATGQTYEATVSGQYFDVVTMNTCSSEPSDTVDIVVGIDEHGHGTYSIYPNPAKGLVNIRIPELNNGIVKISLFSASGKILDEFACQPGEKQMTIDISRLPAGLYFLKVAASDFNHVSRLIVQ